MGSTISSLSENQDFGAIVPKKELISTDFSHSAYFGLVPQQEIPDFYFVVAEPLEIKDQRDSEGKSSDMCGAYAIASVSEDQEGITFEPAYTWQKIKYLLGDVRGYGTDPKTACKVAVLYGFLPKGESPFSLQSKSRDFISDYKNWDSKLDDTAIHYKKGAYFKVDGQKDLFDSIRATMWQNRKEKRSVLVGCYWQPGWFNTPGGVIPVKSLSLKINPHMFKIYGQKSINGVMHLMAQLSNGSEVGDNGTFYIPREIANRFLFAYTFRDANPDDVKAKTWSNIQKLKIIIRDFIRGLRDTKNLLVQERSLCVSCRLF